MWGKAGRAEHRHRSGRSRHVRDDDHASSRRAEWRPGMTYDAARRRDGLGGAAAGRHQRVDDADQGTHRHARHRHSHARSASRSSAPTWRSWSGSGKRDRAGRAGGARHAQRLRRAGGVGLLPRHRHRSRGGGAARPERRRRADRDRHRDRRHDDHADGRGPRALRRARPLSAGTARHAGAAARRCSYRWPMDAAGAGDGGMGMPVAPRRREASAMARPTCHSGRSRPSAQVAGPMVVRTEGAMPTAWVYVDVAGRDIGSYVADAQAHGRRHGARCPPGYTHRRGAASTSTCSAPRSRLRLVIPATLAIIFLLLYFNFSSVGESLIVMLSLPFALVGGIWFIWRAAATTGRSRWRSDSSRSRASRRRPAW